MKYTKLKSGEKKKVWNMKQIYIWFSTFETIRSFGDNVYTGKINLNEDDRDQINLLEKMVEFTNKFRPNTKEGGRKERNTFYSISLFFEYRKFTLNAFKSGILPIKSRQGKWLKILTPKQMLQTLPIALVKAKAGNTSENLLNEIRQTILFLYWEKEITKKVNNNVMNSVKV